MPQTQPMRERPRQVFNFIQPGRMDVRADSDVTEIAIYDEIGFWGVTAADMRKTLDSVTTKTINLKINSPGGDAFDGIAIYNDLLTHPATVNVQITGVAASAASIIAMAGDRIEIADNAFMMIHNAWALSIGDKNELRAMADILETIDQGIAMAYVKRAGIDMAEAASLMAAETWMMGVEAVTAGFADALLGGKDSQAAALYDFSVYAKTPAMLKRQVENGLRSIGYSRAEATGAVAKGFNNLRQRDAGNHPVRDAEGDTALIALLQTIRKSAA